MGIILLFYLTQFHKDESQNVLKCTVLSIFLTPFNKGVKKEKGQYISSELALILPLRL